MTCTRAALAATLLAGSATLLLHSVPAAAQSPLQSLRQNQQGNRAQPQQQRTQVQITGLTREESAAVYPLYQAAQAQDWAAAAGALAAAQAGAQSPAARYLVGQLQFQLARGTQNAAMQGQALDAMLASGGAPAAAVSEILTQQVNLALDANNFAAAETALTRIVEASPGDIVRITQLAQVKARLNKREEAAALLQRAVQLSAASGQPPPEQLLRASLGMSYEGHQAQPAIAQAQALVRAYPTAENWRSALGVYRDLGGLAGSDQIDLYRLMRAAAALGGERDYYEYALAASHGGLPGEAKAVLDEGFNNHVFQQASGDARQMQTAAQARIAEDQASLPRLRTAALAGRSGQAARTTADAYFGYGRYAEAAELYRAALEKGGEDANLINTRLGASLALAGQRPAAEAALHSVTGPRAALAQFWLLWLAGRPAA